MKIIECYFADSLLQSNPTAEITCVLNLRHDGVSKRTKGLFITWTYNICFNDYDYVKIVAEDIVLTGDERPVTYMKVKEMVDASLQHFHLAVQNRAILFLVNLPEGQVDIPVHSYQQIAQLLNS